jgi:predicted transcriptional regulator
MARETELKRVITVSLSPDVIDKLDRIAQRDDRSRSFMIDSILRRSMTHFRLPREKPRRLRNGKAARTAKANNA